MNRIKKLQAVIPAGMDAVLVSSDVSRRYLTGLDYTDGYVLVCREKAYLLADFRYIEVAKKYGGEELEVVLLKGGLPALLGPMISENGIRCMGYEDRKLTCAELSKLKNDFPLMSFEGCGGLIDALREFKDENEIESIIKAQRIAEAAFEHIITVINPEMTENDVALELEYFMRKNGAEGPAFQTIAVSGTASSLPHGVPRNCKLEKGFLTMDFGAKVDGYCSDMTRTVVLGKPDSEMKKVYETVLRAQLDAIEALKNGATGYEADKGARDYIEGQGYVGCFGHGLGHGVGMYIHEAPSVNASNKKPFATGDVITIEPGIYIEGKYGVRIEDMAVFTSEGMKDITLAPKELIVI